MRTIRCIKKTLCILLALCFIFAGFTFVHANEKADFRNKNIRDVKDVTVVVNGQKIVFDSPIKISEGRTLVPLRKIAESLGYEVNYVADEGATNKSVILLYETMEIHFDVYNSDYEFIMDNSVTVRDKVLGIDAGYHMEKAPLIYSGRTYVPLRIISELLSAKIFWDEKTRTVKIDAPIIADSEIASLKSPAEEAESYSYLGQISDGRPDGVGFMCYGFKNSCFYKGRWSKGLPNGSGFMNFSTGEDSYNMMGEFSQGRLMNGTVMNNRGISYIKNGMVEQSLGQAEAFFWHISKDEALNDEWQKSMISALPKIK